MVSWITALKVIPWGEVIDAAPAIAKGARKFFAKTQQTEATVEPEPAVGEAATPQVLHARLRHLEQVVAEMAAQQQASAALIESLAEQNTQVVQAIDVLRARTRLLLGVGAVLLVAVVALSIAAVAG